MQTATSDAERRRRMTKLLRDVARAELVAIDHAQRESRRVGEHAPPAVALRTIALHATSMQARFTAIVTGHDLPVARARLGVSLATIDRVVSAERAYRTALTDVRHGIDVVKLLREVARHEQLFGVIRWCDDWLAQRRTLVAYAELQLAWFAGVEDEPELASAAEDWDDGR